MIQVPVVLVLNSLARGFVPVGTQVSVGPTGTLDIHFGSVEPTMTVTRWEEAISCRHVRREKDRERKRLEGRIVLDGK